MTITILGARGSLPVSGAGYERYGGSTSCALVESGGAMLLLDAGTGILRCATAARRIDILLTHYHLDHIQGLPFLPALHDPQAEVHLYGPGESGSDVRAALERYLSPPLFPMSLGDVRARLLFHPVTPGSFSVDGFRVTALTVCHPGATLGYRIEDAAGRSLVWLPDHEPYAEGNDPAAAVALARDADLLIHDAQYTNREYGMRSGWGHSSVDHALRFAASAVVRRLLLTHHDPLHTDGDLETMHRDAVERCGVLFGVEGRFGVEGARENGRWEVGE